MKYKFPSGILFLILIAFFFRGVFLVGVFPIFKGQDESRHYNTVQYLSTDQDKDCQNKEFDENGKVVYKQDKQIKQDLSTYRYSDEIKETALVVQHKQIRGEYYDKVNFTDSRDGLGERELKSKQYSKTQHVCPPDVAMSTFGKDRFSLYQWGVLGVEKFLSSQDIFVRYNAIRIVSVLLGVVMLWVAYLIFRTVEFSTRQSLILTAIISFQPKLSIYFTNINYDVLLIPLWTGFILVGSIILKKGWNFTNGLTLFLLLAGAIMTKPSALPLLGLGMFLVGRTFYIKFKKQKINWVLVGGIILVGGFISYLLLDKAGMTVLLSKEYLDSLGEYLGESFSRIDGSSSNYWGVIGWSANNLTLLYVKVIWVIEWVAWFGLGLWITGPWAKGLKKGINLKLLACPILKNKYPVISGIISIYEKIKKRCQKGYFRELKGQKKYFWFMLIAVVILQLGIRVADWKVFTKTGGLDLGTPGRYWLPNIIPHFVLLALGLKIIMIEKKYFEFSLFAFLVLMILYWTYGVVDVIIPRFYL